MVGLDDIYGKIGVLFLAILGAGCGTAPIVSSASPDGRGQAAVLQWNESVEKGHLRINLAWAKPMFPGPHPTIIVHPGIGERALDAVDTAVQLARSGYLAVAVDYERRIQGDFQTTTLPWRERSDELDAFNHIVSNPLVDRKNIAALGFSLGGAHTLLMASAAPAIKSVVVYYPMSDFEDWVAERNKSFFWRLVFRFARWDYNAESEHHNDYTHKALLRFYSAVNRSASIQAPVLIVHGDEDRIAPLKHSQRLFEELRNKNQNEVDFMVLNGAGHAFDKQASPHTRKAWTATLSWFHRHLDDQRLALQLN